jgi:hypothetical protein
VRVDEDVTGSINDAAQRPGSCGLAMRRVKPRAVVGAICANATLCRHAARATPWDDL